MAKTPKNSGKSWSPNEVRQLKQELRENTPTRVIALHHGRTPGAVYQKVSEFGLSAKPVNQRPYGRGGRRKSR